jgi:predicted transcriptional regulator
MPDDTSQLTTPLSVRAPSEVVEALDRIAAALDRPRSWVVVYGLQSFLRTKGREIMEDVDSIAALDRGKGIPADVTLAKAQAILDRPRAAHGKTTKAARSGRIRAPRRRLG